MITREQAAFDAALMDERGNVVEADYARTVVALHDEVERLRAELAAAQDRAEVMAEALRLAADSAERSNAEVERLRAEVAKLPATVDQTVNMLRLAEASVSLLRADVADLERERERLQNMIWAANGVLSDNGCDCDCEHHWEEHEPDCERCLACRIDNAMRAAVPESV